ncbi:hypothetical protein ACFYUY_01550 [Kitasatospora sp. NPDC004745]|uniref:hypothetical protein n=1 Tax=Kitasatospora sp. NPDC004745 TaxID=3364019 RepID=UPI003685EEE0
MNYGRIRRGPMAADAFTQIRNALFRDARLSFRDKGVFGLISTHRDGFGVSAESIAAMSPSDGLTAVKSSLRNLEKCGYLQRTRQRNANGTLGGAVYYITDQPEAFEGPSELESPSSEPAVAQPTLVQPTLGGPTLAEPAVVSPTLAELPHKNTNSKHTKSKKTLPPSGPSPKPAADTPAAAGSERETTSRDAETVVAAYAAALARPVSPATRRKLGAQAAELADAGFPVWWLVDRARELADRGWTDLAQHCDRSTVPTARTSVDSRADWCGNCQDPAYRMRKDPARDNELVACDDCHPAAVARRRRIETGAAA